MASTLTVDNIVGATAAAKVHIPGHVIQVVEGTATSDVATSTATFVTCGLSASITPLSASSKILIIANISGHTVVSDARLITTVYRNSTNLGGGSMSGVGYLHAPAGTHLGIVSMSILDSPSSTSSVTYTVYFGSGSNVGEVRVRSDVVPSKIQLMEIAQ